MIGEHVFLLFLGSFFLFYIFFIYKDAYRTFFITIILCAVIWLTYKNNNVNAQKTRQVAQVFDELENDIADIEFVTKNNVQFHKSPKTLKYVKMEPRVMALVNMLYKLKVYDKKAIIMIVIKLEYFMKMHYNVMIGKYDVAVWYNQLLDLKNDIINDLHAMCYTVPKVSKVIHVPRGDVEAYLEKVQLMMHSLLASYIKIIKRKYRAIHADAPYAFDTHHDNKYDIV